MKILGKQHQDGQGLVEYALILALVSITVIGVLLYLGPQVAQAYQQVIDVLGDGDSDSDTICQYKPFPSGPWHIHELNGSTNPFLGTSDTDPGHQSCGW